ncbi:MAG TPA: carbohydrate-binding family V/XII, partial [Bacteroidota bacterium]|nr:carbohydrate-binding family V/XII [Bacteroidota bacterium]
EAVTLAAKSASESQAGDNADEQTAGATPEIIVSTAPAELISSDGPLRMAPIAGTGLLYAANTTSRVFLEIDTQMYFFLSSGRWYRSKGLSGPWSSVPSNSLPGDFARIPPGSERDDVLASVAGTVPAKEAVLDAQVPRVAEVDRAGTTSSVQFDGPPQFARIEGTPMQYAVNASSPVIALRGRFYNCDRGVWFVSPTTEGPWSVCTRVPPVIYTIPPSYPVYYVRYARVYGFSPAVVYAGYTPGYTGAYVFGGTVVYGTGYWYRPWFRRYYYPRPWTWGFGVHYDPWTGWALGYPVPWWRPRGWFVYGGWGVVHAGWWGPLGYRPYFRAYAGPAYGAGYRPLAVNRGAVRTSGMVRTASVYDRWGSGVRGPAAGFSPRPARDAQGTAGAQRGGARVQGARRGMNAPAGAGRGGNRRPGARGGRGGGTRGEREGSRR